MSNEVAMAVLTVIKDRYSREMAVGDCSKYTAEAVKEAIDIAIEAVKKSIPVTCKECKYYNNRICTRYINSNYTFYMNSEDSCNRAERK